MKLSDMKNIGKKLEMLLKEVDINTPDELMDLGSVEATYRLNEINEACCNKLYALEGALQNVRWHNLSDECKAELKKEYKRIISNEN